MMDYKHIIKYLTLAVFSLFCASQSVAQDANQECEVIDFSQFSHSDAISSLSLFGGTFTLNVNAFRNEPDGSAVAVDATAYDTERWDAGNPPPNPTHYDTQLNFLCNDAANGGLGNCDGIEAVIPDAEFEEDGDATRGGTITFTSTGGDFEILRYDAVDSDSFRKRIILNVGGVNVGQATVFGNGSVITVFTDDHRTTQAEFEFRGSGGIDDIEVCRFVENAALGDFVWEDLDADGIQDAGEPGIGDVTVNLLTPGVDGECDTGDEVFVVTTTTDAAGLYLFDNLTPGRYCVEFDKPSAGQQLQCLDIIGGVQFSPQNEGGDDTIDSDANPITGQTGNIDLNAGDNDLTNDAGFYCPAKIGDVLFNDLNRNGIQEPLLGETGFTPGQLVELVECVGGVPGTTVIDSTTTDGDGMYMFNPLPPGEYAVIFSKPADYVFSPKDQGGDETKDCDTDATGATECVTLDPNEYNPDVDACIYMPPPECDLVVDKTCVISEPPTSDFTCEKPIDELSMIWNGPQNNVRVIAHKGKTSDPILANIAGILIGQTVVINGFAGSPNDVIWEIFDASDVKIGESTFHLSCSDSGMNGPEDCGMPQGDGKDGKCPKGVPKGTDCSGLFLNQWLLEGMVDSVGELTCSSGGTPPADFPMANSCSFTTASADVTYGYKVTNNGDLLTGVAVIDDQLGTVGGPDNLDMGESVQYTAMSTIFGTTTNVATATGTFANGDICEATAELTVEKVIQPGSCDDGKATELVFEYTGDACSATTNYQLDNKGNAKFSCSPEPGMPLAALSSVAFTKDADKLTAEINGNTLRIFRSDTLGEKLAAETKYVLTDTNGDEQAQTLHTSCSKPLAVDDQFGALKLIQIINEF